MCPRCGDVPGNPVRERWAVQESAEPLEHRALAFGLDVAWGGTKLRGLRQRVGRDGVRAQVRARRLFNLDRSLAPSRHVRRKSVIAVVAVGRGFVGPDRRRIVHEHGAQPGFLKLRLKIALRGDLRTIVGVRRHDGRGAGLAREPDQRRTGAPRRTTSERPSARNDASSDLTAAQK